MRSRPIGIVIAQAIGLPDAFMEVRDLLYRNARLAGRSFERIAASRKASVEPLFTFEGDTFLEFYSEAVCGGIPLQARWRRRGKPH